CSAETIPFRSTINPSA
ncbi:hypothetical protein A2U01_0109894, partial [Trifolium medium]|nr:hypothetical protein [Trifolium medium]